MDTFIQSAPKKTLAQAALEEAITELGVREVGGPNRGKSVEVYQKEAGISPGDAWCAAFVNWCARKQSKLLGIDSPLEKVPLQGYVQSYFEHFRNSLVSLKAARPGDLLVIYYPSLGRYGHIGFIERVVGNTMHTVEGNTNAAGSREGNCVARKQREYTGNTKIIRWTDK